MLKVYRDHLFFNEFKILFILVGILFLISFFGQFSSFDAAFNVIVIRHCVRIASSFLLIILIYLLGLKFWMNFAYVFYVLAFCALAMVEIFGTVKLGAQRWVDLHFFMFQPSELMKIALIVSVARYYSLLSEGELDNCKNHLVPSLMILVPVALILKQPDLGTAMVMLCVGVGLMFISGFPLRYFISILIAGLCSCPFLWFTMHDYQKNRILTFLNPDKDPLGTGYHVLQSKIAIGSGGLIGKGLFKGTQSKLNFLPEKNTDFIFTSISEEIGFVGSAFIICIFLVVSLYFLWSGTCARMYFSKLTCCGLSILFFMHVFVNIAMVIGVLPVVGIPLPFLSYGGSSMMTFAIGCGIVMSSIAYRKKY